MNWYRELRPGLEADLVLCVDEALDRILENPEAFQTVRPGVRRAVLCRFPYGIFFRVRAHRIEVVAVYHSRRNPTDWRNRSR